MPAANPQIRPRPNDTEGTVGLAAILRQPAAQEGNRMDDMQFRELMDQLKVIADLLDDIKEDAKVHHSSSDSNWSSLDSQLSLMDSQLGLIDSSIGLVE